MEGSSPLIPTCPSAGLWRGVHLYYPPALLQAYAEKEGEEELVFFKQRAADILVDAEGKVVTEICDPGCQVRRRLTVDDGLDTQTIKP